MLGTRHVSASWRGRSVLALSALALLALACFPVLAQADSSGIQYSDAPPTVTGSHKIPTQSAPPAHSSKADGGAAHGKGNGSGSSGKGSSAGGSSSKSGGSPGTARGDGTGQQGSPGQGSGGKSNTHATPAGSGAEPVLSKSDGGSSPLVPILIAIAVLAAISIGAVMMRQRRRRDSGVSVSPEAS
jgi:cobalamin biosynthesis Mg chelatase CobN